METPTLEVKEGETVAEALEVARAHGELGRCLQEAADELIEELTEAEEDGYDPAAELTDQDHEDPQAEPKAPPRAFLDLVASFASLTHRYSKSGSEFVVRLKAEAENLRIDQVREAREAGYCHITYARPIRTAARVTLVGRLDGSRPNNPEEIWLGTAGADEVTFTIIHEGGAEMLQNIRALLDLVIEPEAVLHVRLAPQQPKLL